MAALVSDPLGEEKKKKTALKKSGGDCDQTGILARGQLLRRWLLPPVLAAGAALFLVSHYVGYGTFWNLTPTAQLNREDLFTVWMVEEKQLVRKKPADVSALRQKAQDLESHDPALIEMIQEHHLQPPKTSGDYHLDYQYFGAYETSVGQTQLIRKLFEDKRDGFYIECGAYDGQRLSNSLTLERDLGWEGLLAEADPTSISTLSYRNRRAWILPNCLSTTDRPSTVKFLSWGLVGKIVQSDQEAAGALKQWDLAHSDLETSLVPEVLCFPLISVLLALNRTKVDFFSLDVEGHELEILKTIPFDEVDITALAVEYTHIGKQSGTGTKNELVTFMESKGYTVRATVTHLIDLAGDYIFVKEGFREDIKLESIHRSL